MPEKIILGVKLFSGTAAEVVEAGLRGGLVVVPSAPVLVDMAERPALREALLNADMAVTDSGLMVLLWRLLKREKIERVSGLEYLKLLLQMLKPESGKRKAEGSDPSAESTSSAFSFQPSAFSGGQPATANPQVSGFSPQVSHAAGGGAFWVMPTVAARDRNIAWLRSQGFQITADNCYVAPVYPPDGPLSDRRLVELVLQRHPAHIIMALGGGVQERLGWFLKQELEKEPGAESLELGASHPQVSDLRSQVSAAIGYRPGIHCIGAAIGFLSGEQVRIPMWVDYLYLGWFWRSVSAPRRFVPRYWKARRLVWLMIRYRDKAPGADSRGRKTEGR